MKMKFNFSLRILYGDTSVEVQKARYHKNIPRNAYSYEIHLYPLFSYHLNGLSQEGSERYMNIRIS
jgi:hypothetical protein